MAEANLPYSRSSGSRGRRVQRVTLQYHLDYHLTRQLDAIVWPNWHVTLATEERVGRRIRPPATRLCVGWFRRLSRAL